MRSILKPTIWGLLLSTCVCLQAQTPRTSRNGQTLAGTWLESVTFQGSTFKVLASFTQDGRGTVLLPFGPGGVKQVSAVPRRPRYYSVAVLLCQVQ